MTASASSMPMPIRSGMDATQLVREVLRDVLSLGGRADGLSADSELLGVLPELDSMAVANILAALEERLGILIDDADLSADTFSTFGALTQFVSDQVTG
jgi:acyl carrier protein